MHIKHHPTSPPSPFIPWTILTVLFNTVESYSKLFDIFQISSPIKRAVATVEDGCRESSSSDGRKQGGREMNPKSSLEEKQASRGATRNIWQHASPDDRPRAKSQLKYTYIFAHRFSGFAGRQLTSRRVINIKAGTSFHHYRRHLSWYKYGYNRYTVIRVKSRILRV